MTHEIEYRIKWIDRGGFVGFGEWGSVDLETGEEWIKDLDEKHPEILHFLDSRYVKASEPGAVG